MKILFFHVDSVKIELLFEWTRRDSNAQQPHCKCGALANWSYGPSVNFSFLKFSKNS